MAPDRRDEPGAGGEGRSDPAYAEAIGRAIQVLRTERGISRAALAKMAGLSYSYLSEIETGKKEGSPKALYALTEALGVTPSALHVLAEERVLPTMLEAGLRELTVAEEAETPRRFRSAPESAPGRRSWFGRGVVAEEAGERSPASPPPGRGDERADKAELAAIFEALSPADRALLLEFARRLRR